MVDRSRFHATSIFIIYQEIFNSEIKLFQTYILEVSDQFESKTRELNNWNTTTLENHQQNARDEEYFKNAIDFPKILNSSLLISLQTVLEKTLKWIIDKSEVIFNPSQMPKKNNRESDLNYYVRVLSSACQLNISTQSHLLAQLGEFRIIRNLFVHSGGNLFWEKDQQRKTLAKKIIEQSDERLLLNEHTGEIVIYNKQYLISFSQKIQAFLISIFDQLIEKHNKLIKEDNKYSRRPNSHS
jgi:hypothetical protein